MRSMTDEGRCRGVRLDAQHCPSSARRCRAPSPASGRRARPVDSASRRPIPPSPTWRGCAAGRRPYP
jgi:hypothetical protein